MELDVLAKEAYIVALNEAKLKSHEYVTPEHFLYALINFDAGKRLLEESGVDIMGLHQELEDYLNNYIPDIGKEEPIESFQYVLMFQLATKQAVHADMLLITTGSLLVSMLNMPDSHAYTLLMKHGAEEMQLLQYLAKEKRQLIEGDTYEGAETDSFLEKYAVNMMEAALNHEYDEIIGREKELERAQQILGRRRKNNVIFLGDAGVGKSAMVEGLACLLGKKHIPVYQVDMSQVIAGTKYRGDFEERFLNILDEASRIDNAILYFDEIHSLVGTGAVASNSMDASGMIKPFLSKGKLRFIGATTYEEYKKHFEKDYALTRRFQSIPVEEATIEETIDILMGIKETYEIHHQVSYSDDAISEAAKLSKHFLHDKRLPDAAIDVIDETGSSLHMKRNNDDIIQVQTADIEATIALMAQIPQKEVNQDDLDTLRELKKNIEKKLFGQDEAVNTVVTAIQAARAGLNDPDRPLASLLFVGPSGVGKTELSRLLASEMNMPLMRYDMSEYQEEHSVARLIGAPPGYVGYEKGGLLTEAIRQQPHGVLLLDEIEKAHESIFNVLLQVLDYGMLTDNTGAKADFRNIIIIMTSNAGARDMNKRTIGFEGGLQNEAAIHAAVNRVFTPEFRNRLDDIIVFNHLDEDMALKVVGKELEILQRKVKDQHIDLIVPHEVMQFIAGKALSNEYGAREIHRFINGDMKKQLAEIILFSQTNKHKKLLAYIEDEDVIISSQ